MSECICDRFGLVEDNSDSFETWMGLRGPAGPAGSGVKLRGPVETSGDLPASAEPDEMWLVGAAAPYTGYFWNGSSWVSAGQLAVGPVGPSPSFSVGTVSTLPAGSDAEVTITGTDEEPVLNFGLPRGATGATGADGPQGPAGPGVPDGGSAGQILAKASGANQDTEWVNNIAAATATPLMDGTGAVGSSAKYAKEDHVHPHDSLICRKNLLDNWYFVGGGSQQGYGVFPINQRGQASYSSFGHSIDRWRLSTGGTLTVNSDSIRFDAGASTNYTEIRQYFSQALPPGTYTWSMLAKINSVSGTVWMGLRDSSNIVQHSITISSATSGYALFTKTFTLSSTATGWSLSLVTSNAATDTINADIKAFKLELGDTQTLAHQENGNWVLNEVPEYGEELQKCQRYFLKAAYATDQVFCSGFLTNGGQDYTMLVPCPTEMVRNPTVTMTSWFARGATGYSAYATYSAPKAPVSLTCYKSPVIRNQLVIIDSIGTTSPDANNTSWVFSIINLTISCEP